MTLFKTDIGPARAVTLRVGVYNQLLDFDLLAHAGSARLAAGSDMTRWQAALQINEPWFQGSTELPPSQAGSLSKDLCVLNGVLGFACELVEATLGFKLTAAWKGTALPEPGSAQRGTDLAPLVAMPTGSDTSLSPASWGQPLDAALAALAGLENSILGAALHLELAAMPQRSPGAPSVSPRPTICAFAK